MCFLPSCFLFRTNESTPYCLSACQVPGALEMLQLTFCFSLKRFIKKCWCMAPSCYDVFCFRYAMALYKEESDVEAALKTYPSLEITLDTATISLINYGLVRSVITNAYAANKTPPSESFTCCYFLLLNIVLFSLTPHFMEPFH